MFRSGGAVLVLLLGLAGQASAQSWADKLFDEKVHDFGAVPRSAKIEYTFVMTNRFLEDIHIAGVRSSCGCTLPRVTKDTLKNRESGAIVAEFNTRAFLGQHGAHLTVTIDKPYYAEAHLEVKGYIRTDVSMTPGEVNFGTIEPGSKNEQTVRVEYAGGSDWRIEEVKPGSNNIAAMAKEISRSQGRAVYNVTVRLAGTNPAGYLREQVTLVTNDKRTPEVPVIIEGQVIPELAVSPTALMLGTLQPGQTVSKQLIIRSKRPCHITSVKADGGAFECKVPSGGEAKKIHLVPVKFTAGGEPGKLAHKIRVETDLGPQSSAEIEVFGEVASSLAEIIGETREF